MRHVGWLSYSQKVGDHSEKQIVINKYMLDLTESFDKGSVYMTLLVFRIKRKTTVFNWQKLILLEKNA